jgi:hypothetical protein
MNHNSGRGANPHGMRPMQDAFGFRKKAFETLVEFAQQILSDVSNCKRGSCGPIDYTLLGSS